MLKLLDPDKININWNKKPIKMKDFLSYLTIETVATTDHLGYSYGWTQRVNKAKELIIKGGIIKGVEYLDSLKYGKRLRSEGNDFVNPLYLFDIMTKEGREFFYNYYKEDMERIIKDQQVVVSKLTIQTATESSKLSEYEVFVSNIKQDVKGGK